MKKKYWLSKTKISYLYNHSKIKNKVNPHFCSDYLIHMEKAPDDHLSFYLLQCQKCGLYYPAKNKKYYLHYLKEISLNSIPIILIIAITILLIIEAIRVYTFQSVIIIAGILLPITAVKGFLPLRNIKILILFIIVEIGSIIALIGLINMIFYG